MDYPYGEERWSLGTLPTDYRFTDQRREPQLAIYHMGARWFDSYLSRWLSADSIVPDPSDPQSLNRYSWVLGNPLRYRDPSGQIEEDEVDDALEVREQLWALGVAILIDWYRMADGSWYRGLWTLEVLNWVRSAVLDMAGAMGGSDAFAEALPEGVIIERATASRYGAELRGAETDPRGDWIRLFDAALLGESKAEQEASVKSALVHELTHAWNIQGGRQLEADFEQATFGRTTARGVYEPGGTPPLHGLPSRSEDLAYSTGIMIYGLQADLGSARYGFGARKLPGARRELGWHTPGR